MAAAAEASASSNSSCSKQPLKKSDTDATVAAFLPTARQGSQSDEGHVSAQVHASRRYRPSGRAIGNSRRSQDTSMSHRRFRSGNPAVLGTWPVDRWLCVPTFRLVCPVSVVDSVPRESPFQNCNSSEAEANTDLAERNPTQNRALSLCRDRHRDRLFSKRCLTSTAMPKSGGIIYVQSRCVSRRRSPLSTLNPGFR
jgi:hypothetical protein